MHICNTSEMTAPQETGYVTIWEQKQTCSLANSFIWLTGNQARYVSVVRHHRGTPTMMTTAAMDRAASWPRLRSEKCKRINGH